ncbi:30S ribosome-binding factor RbfA [Amorphus sp. 3PC139-8]|uniref:30S ribosome-binding factor RbfA n=1 Tax=Amorphus sp. 3PC139-8 TaxID=2735676 RepID=UPI00345C7B84
MTFSQRQLRVGELVRHALSDIFMRGDVHGLAVPSHLVTVPEVRMSPDLKVATVLVMPLGGGDRATTVKALEASRRELKAELSKRVELKFLPDLRFVIDTRYDDDDRINALLDSPDVRKDVEDGTEDEA